MDCGPLSSKIRIKESQSDFFLERRLRAWLCDCRRSCFKHIFDGRLMPERIGVEENEVEGERERLLVAFEALELKISSNLTEYKWLKPNAMWCDVMRYDSIRMTYNYIWCLDKLALHRANERPRARTHSHTHWRQWAKWKSVCETVHCAHRAHRTKWILQNFYVPFCWCCWCCCSFVRFTRTQSCLAFQLICLSHQFFSILVPHLSSSFFWSLCAPCIHPFPLSTVDVVVVVAVIFVGVDYGWKHLVRLCDKHFAGIWHSFRLMVDIYGICDFSIKLIVRYILSVHDLAL